MMNMNVDLDICLYIFLNFLQKNYFKSLCKIIIKIQYGNKKLHLDLHSFIWVFR